MKKLPVCTLFILITGIISGQPAQEMTPAGMALIHGGIFMMGSNDNRDFIEFPAHQVTLGPFYMDIHEVTNRQ
jgi:formylglycine-generating enzyme required for sulfatase activity